MAYCSHTPLMERCTPFDRLRMQRSITGVRIPMKKLFKPAIVLMNQLKYPQKFILISFFFILPLALVIILLIPSFNDRIDFTQKELYGNTYLHPLRRLLEHSLQNKIIAHNYLSGDKTL